MSIQKKAISCLQVAKYFLSQIDEEAGDLISNLKLQKLLYYAQGYHLALFDCPLFNEKIEAWVHGPVVPDVYHDYKKYGANPIPKPEDLKLASFDQETLDLLNEVYSVLGQFSAWKLRNMTHEEPPWRDAYNKSERGLSNIITHNALKEYFKDLVE